MLHRYFADNTDAQSVASRLRKQRFQLFVDMVNRLPPVVKVLDIGGTQGYWERVTKGSSLLDNVHITLVNIQPQATSLPNLISITGDARSMPQFSDRRFDIVFSNSTIEHVGNFSDQQKMADEVMRIGKYYYVQTPNRYFPIEPHFVFPFFQFLPINLRVWLVRHYKLGFYPKIPDYQKALSAVKIIRLMTIHEVRQLFPQGTIYKEKYLCMTKSIIAYRPVQ